jgi:hypothetical protein
MNSTHAAMNLPAAQAGDVRVDNAAGHDVVNQGLDGDHVVELLGGRLERWLERIVQVQMWVFAAVAVQTVLLLLVILPMLFIVGPRLVAGL